MGDVTLEDLGSIKSEIEPVQLAFERKDWEQGFGIIRQCLANPDFTSRLYPLRGNKDDEIYVPVERYFLSSLLAMVPPEEAERFRASFDPAVERAIRSAREGDPRMLEQMENRLAVSRAAPDAYRALGALCWERGDPWRAADLWRRGAEAAGGTDAEAVARYLLAAAPLGRVDETLAARATSVRLPGAEVPVARWKGLFGGSERDAREAGASWPQFGGSPTGTAHAAPVPQGTYVSLRGAGLVSSSPGAAVQRQGQPGQPGWRRIPYHGVISGGRIHLSDGLNYSAYELTSGKKKAGSSNPPVASARMHYGGGLPDYSFSSPCATPEAVYIYTAAPQDAGTRGMGGQQTFIPSIVQAFDPVTGKTLPIRFAYAEGRTPLDLGGAPVAWRRYLFATGVDQNGGLNLVCFDRFRGAELWRTFLCFKSNPVFRGFGFQMEAMPTFLAIDRETIYVCTNRGALVSVDPHSGRRNWAVRYPALSSPNPNNPAQAGRGWDANPVIAHEGRVLIAPMDSQSLLCFDGADGSLAWKTSPFAREEPYQHVLGPVDGKVYAIGARGGLVLEWQGGKRLQTIMGFSGGGFLGRPVITSDSLLVAARETPTQGGIYRVDLRSNKLSERLIAWPEQSAAQYGADRLPDGANLALVDGHLVAVTDRVFYIYSLSADAVSDLEERIRKKPADAEAYLTLARFHLGKGDGSQAVDVLKRAIQRPGVSDEDAELLRGLDEVCGTFVREAMEKGRGEEVPSFLERLVRDIPAAAARPTLRLALARSLESRGQRDRAAEIYAELAQAPAAKVDLGGGLECHLPAYAEAQLWRMARKGPPAKGVRDWAAAAQGRAQEASREPGKRAREAARLAPWGLFASGPRAVSDIVNALEAAGQREEARAAYLGALSRLDGSDAAARALEGVRDEALARGLVGALASVDPAVELRLGAARRSAEQHVAEVLGLRSDGKPPAAPAWRGKGQPGTAYLTPSAGDRSASMREWILPRSPAQGKAYDAVTGAEATLKWPKELATVSGAFQAGGFVIVQGAQGIAAVDPETLKPVWTLPVGGAFRASAAGGVLVVGTPQSVMGADLQTGDPLWSFRIEGSYELCVHPAGRLALAGSTGLQIRDLKTGEKASPVIALPPFERVFLRAGRSAAVAVLGRSQNRGWVRGFDLATCKQRFEAEEPIVVGWEDRVLPSDGDRVAYPSGMELRILDLSAWESRRVAIRTDNQPPADIVLGEKDVLIRTIDRGGAQMRLMSFRMDGGKRWELPCAVPFPLLVDIGRWVVYCAPFQPSKPGVAGQVRLELADRESGRREAEIASLPAGSVGGEWWAGSRGVVIRLAPSGELIGISRGKAKGEKNE